MTTYPKYIFKCALFVLMNSFPINLCIFLTNYISGLALSSEQQQKLFGHCSYSTITTGFLYTFLFHVFFKPEINKNFIYFLSILFNN